jgi:hypothetical protein
VPDIKTAQRFRILDDHSQGAPQQFIAMYEVETDDLPATMATVQQRLGTEQMPMSEAFEMSTAVFLVAEPITEKLVSA